MEIFDAFELESALGSMYRLTDIGSSRALRIIFDIWEVTPRFVHIALNHLVQIARPGTAEFALVEAANLILLSSVVFSAYCLK